MLAWLSAHPSQADSGRYVLPIPDTAYPAPSPPAVAGRLVRATTGELAIQSSAVVGPTVIVVRVALVAGTRFWTADGGAYDANELVAGQYVWVWYAREELHLGVGVPRAAVVMLHSSSPNDQPSPEDLKAVESRWSP